MVIDGWREEVPVQCEGRAAAAAGDERERCLRHYLEQHPDGRQRAKDLAIVLVRVQPDWGRLSDYRPASFGSQAISLDR